METRRITMRLGAPIPPKRPRVAGAFFVASLVMLTLAACSLNRSDPAATDGGSSATAVASPSASDGYTVFVGPGRAVTSFGGTSPEVPVTVTLPTGWHADDWFVLKSGADPAFGLVLSDVANVFVDGCQWQPADPPVGPTVEDLVAAYATQPGFDPTVHDITVDGNHGKRVEFTMPDYDADECIEGKFAILQNQDMVGGIAPSLWAHAPRQRNTMWILDVDGTRLQILSGQPPGISEQDRRDLEAMIDSIEIGDARAGLDPTLIRL
jgi:hypothetical protein